MSGLELTESNGANSHPFLINGNKTKPARFHTVAAEVALEAIPTSAAAVLPREKDILHKRAAASQKSVSPCGYICSSALAYMGQGFPVAHRASSHIVGQPFAMQLPRKAACNSVEMEKSAA